MRERNRSESNWRTAEPRHQPAEGVSQDGAEDGLFADVSTRRADTGAFQDELPPGSGYGLGGETAADPATRQGARDSRAGRPSDQGEVQDRESWSHARP